LKFTTFTCVRK